MKAEKMYLKISKIAEDAWREKRSLHYLNEDGMYFSLDGHVGYFLPPMYNIKIKNGSNLSIKKAPSTLKDYFNTNGKNTHPASEITRGKIANPKKNILRKNNILRLKNELCTVYIQEKFIREFPANTVYYISAPKSPVVAGIWQDEKLYAFAVIMPIRLPDNYFVEREQVMVAAYEMR